jgi:hypothetical protein
MTDKHLTLDELVDLAADRRLASDLVRRLNILLAHSRETRRDIARLLNTYVPVHRDTMAHPHIQCRTEGDHPVLGPLGLINGLVGVIADVPAAGWGYISAVFSDDNLEVVAFERTDSEEVRNV